MRRPTYTVVTLVIVVVAVFAFIQRNFLRLVPPANSNELVNSDQNFLAIAGHQPIDWHPIDANPIPEGLKSGKPILLVVGIPGSKPARHLDDAAFGDNETARNVAQKFFCIRIDGFEHPEWVNAILPITRLRQQLGASFQVWTLGSGGHVLKFIGRDSTNQTPDPQALWRSFDSAFEQYAKYGSIESRNIPYFDMQQLDLDLLESTKIRTLPSFSAATKTIRDVCDFGHGGFPRNGIQGLSPNIWRFLTLTGDSWLWKASLDPILLSPMVDLQDGGFFNLSESPDFTKVDMDKSTRRNAEMMLTLALQGQIDNDRLYKYLSIRTFDWLLSQVKRNGLLAACQLDDEDQQGRSPRLSFPNWRLRDQLDSADAAWARSNLDLEPGSNPQMIPNFRSRQILEKDQERCDQIFAKLRASTDDIPALSDAGYLDVNGHSMARMLEVNRLWGDADRARQLRPFVAKLDRFLTTNGVLHRSDRHVPEAGYLGDYLGYADAKLQEYLSTGDIESFRSGLIVLRQAISTFQGKHPGEFNLCGDPKRMGGFPNFCVPEIADNLGESCSAQMARLLLAYGRLTADSPEGKSLIGEAHEVISLFANVAVGAGIATGGYDCAAAEVADDLYAVAVGPGAQSLSNALYRRVPVRFVAPAVGFLRADLQKRAPGIYLVGETVQGPYSVEEAALRLPATLVTRR